MVAGHLTVVSDLDGTLLPRPVGLPPVTNYILGTTLAEWGWPCLILPGEQP